MTPKEKAEELVNRYLLEIECADRYAFNLPSMNLFISKKCALIAVDELHRIAPWSLENDIFFLILSIIFCKTGRIKEDSKQYWQEVKQEIKKL